MRYLLVITLLLLTGCGFKPLYGQPPAGSVDAGMNFISIDPIDAGRPGQVLQSALEDRFSPAGPPAHVPLGLAASVSKSLVPAVIEPDGNVLRYNLLLDVRFRLYRKADNAALFADTARRISSYNVSESDFSSFVAERDATERGLREMAEDIRLRVAAWLQSHPQAGQ